MWENTVEPGRPQMTIWRMRIACWVPKATHTHAHTHTLSLSLSQYVILTVTPVQQQLHERALMLLYTYIDCLV